MTTMSAEAAAYLKLQKICKELKRQNEIIFHETNWENTLCACTKSETEERDSLLHEAFGFRTDYEFISNSSMRSIVKETKAHDFKPPTVSSFSQHFHGYVHKNK